MPLGEASGESLGSCAGRSGVVGVVGGNWGENGDVRTGVCGGRVLLVGRRVGRARLAKKELFFFVARRRPSSIFSARTRPSRCPMSNAFSAVFFLSVAAGVNASWEGWDKGGLLIMMFGELHIGEDSAMRFLPGGRSRGKEILFSGVLVAGGVGYGGGGG